MATTGELNTAKEVMSVREEQIEDLKVQLDDMRKQRDMRVEQLGDLAVLSQSANENIKKTLDQLEKKDAYLSMLQAAKTKTDSMNLALAVVMFGVALGSIV